MNMSYYLLGEETFVGGSESSGDEGDSNNSSELHRTLWIAFGTSIGELQYVLCMHRKIRNNAYFSFSGELCSSPSGSLRVSFPSFIEKHGSELCRQCDVHCLL